MEKKNLYEDKHLRLEYVPEGNYLHETWWGMTPGKKFAELLEVIINKLVETGANGLLLDAREHKGLGPESQNLAAQRIGEHAQKYGNLKEAIIVPTDVFSKFSVENYAKKGSENNIVIRQYFDDVEKAEAWLKESR